MKNIQELLLEVEALERDSHQLWNESFTNMAFSNLSEESRQKYIQQRYEATRKHSKAMDNLRRAQAQLKELIDNSTNFN